MTKIITVLCSIFSFCFSNALLAKTIGAISAIEGSFIYQTSNQETKVLNRKNIDANWLTFNAKDTFTIKSDKGCLHYWLTLKDDDVLSKSFCGNKGQRLIMPDTESYSHSNKLEINIEIVRNDSKQLLNVNTHMPKQTAIVDDHINLNWSPLNIDSELKAVYMNDKELFPKVTNKSIKLPIKTSSIGWQNWELVFNDATTLKGKVRHLNQLEFLEIENRIKMLTVTNPHDRAISRAMIFINYELYLNAWQTLHSQINTYHQPGILHLLRFTEQSMGL